MISLVVVFAYEADVLHNKQIMRQTQMILADDGLRGRTLVEGFEKILASEHFNGLGDFAAGLHGLEFWRNKKRFATWDQGLEFRRKKRFAT